MDKKMLSLVAIFILTFTLFTTLLVFKGPIARFTRASEEYNVSADNSILLGCPLILKADGLANCTIYSFITSKKGTPLANKNVRLSTSLGLLTPPSAVTDNTGKAQFNLTSTTPGVAIVKATVEDVTVLTHPIKITFQ
ncbi:Ig-like domain-containing protein [Candidatus Roizmanbacteria bacterium]|nr:Ig-like domain-containing protein [Candidatus Roizmanbacteria bacterium]